MPENAAHLCATTRPDAQEQQEPTNAKKMILTGGNANPVRNDYIYHERR